MRNSLAQVYPAGSFSQVPFHWQVAVTLRMLPGTRRWEKSVHMNLGEKSAGGFEGGKHLQFNTFDSLKRAVRVRGVVVPVVVRGGAVVGGVGPGGERPRRAALLLLHAAGQGPAVRGEGGRALLHVGHVVGRVAHALHQVDGGLGK